MPGFAVRGWEGLESIGLWLLQVQVVASPEEDAAAAGGGGVTAENMAMEAEEEDDPAAEQDEEGDGEVYYPQVRCERGFGGSGERGRTSWKLPGI